LEGLEITELNLSEVRRENTKLRLDSGYFAKPMLAADLVVRGYRDGHDELGLLFSRFIKGIFDINANSYCDEGIPFLRILNLRHGAIDESNITYISESVHQSEIKTELKRGDIVLSKTAYPAASLITLERCNTSQDTIATSLSKYGLSAYRAEAIVCYLNSSIGRRLMSRQFQGNVQLHLSLDDGRKVPIPRFGLKLQAKIVSVFQMSQFSRQESSKRLTEAEDILEKALGFKDLRAVEPPSFIRRSKDVFGAGRLDAEYFTPRVLALLKLLGRDGLNISDVASVRREKFKSIDVKDYFRYIEIGDVNNDGTVESSLIASDEAPSRATQYVRKGDVLTSTVRPIRRLSALVSDEQDGSVCSSGFIVLEPFRVSGPTLLTYLRLPLVCELMDLHTSASLYPAISEKSLLGLPIPLIDTDVQGKIGLAMLQAKAAKKRASELLSATDYALQIAIEDSERAALAYLEGVTATKDSLINA